MAQTAVPTYRGREEGRPGPCPHCGETCWADLREPAVLEALAEWEESLRRTRDARFRGWMTLGAALAALIVAVFAARPDGSLVVFGPLLGLVGIVAVRRGLASLALGRRPSRPIRWRLASVPDGPALSRPIVVTSADGELLRAPISGRPCLAYELAVRDDHDDRGAAWTWKLVEQRSVDLRVGAERLDGERVRLDLPRSELTVASSEARRHALRVRGFDPAIPGLVVYETIVVPGHTLTLKRHRGGGALLGSAAPVLRAAA